MWEVLSTEEFAVRGGNFHEGVPDLPALFRKLSEIEYKKIVVN